MEPRKSRYRLLLRVYAAENLRSVSSHGTYCKIYVGNADMAVSRKGRQSFKKFLQQSQANGNNNTSNSSANATTGGSVNTTRMREFKTKVQKFSRANPVWNEKFEVPVVDAHDDLISLRVKSARLMSSPAVGACCVPLHDVPEEETVDRWVRLQDGKKDAGRVRIQIRLVRLDGATQPQQQPTEPKTTENNGATVGSSRRTSSSRSTSSNPSSSSSSADLSQRSHPTHERSLAATDPTVYSSQSASSRPSTRPQTDTEHSQSSSSSSYSVSGAPYPNGSTTSFMSFNSEDYADDDADSYDGDALYDSRRGGDQNSSLLSSFRSLDRGTLLSEIGTPRTHGSFVGSLHQYNRNSIATSTPSRTTMVMSELEIAALSQQFTSDGPDGRHSGETEDTDSEEVDDDEFDVDGVSDGPRIPWNSTITRLLARKSMNVLIDEEEDDDDIGLSTVSGSAPVERDSVPILDFPEPHDIDEIDCAWDDEDDDDDDSSSNNDSRRSNGSSLYMWDVSSDRASSDSLSW
ncbi:C2 domain, partial [Globisporangium splendens]